MSYLEAMPNIDKSETRTERSMAIERCTSSKARKQAPRVLRARSPPARATRRWIVDVDGVRLVIAAGSDGATETVRSEVRQIVESIRSSECRRRIRRQPPRARPRARRRSRRPLPPAAGPVPPNARCWKVTVDNESSEPATLFVAGETSGTFRLVGSATPNVVPAGATMKVTFLFPAKGPDDGWITVNPRLGEGADVGSVGADNIGMPGKILITAECGGCWVGPAQ